MEIFGEELTFWAVTKTLLLIVLIFSLYDWVEVLVWKWRYNIKCQVPLPLVGTVFYMGNADIQMRNVKQYGPVVGALLGTMKVVAVNDVDILKKILIKDHSRFQNRFSHETMDRPPVDKSLLSLRDAHWKRVRGIITPSFSASKLKKMTGDINRCADDMVKGLVAKAELKEVIDPRRHFGCFTMDVIASTAFGIETNSYNTPDDPFVQHAQRIFSASVFSPLVFIGFIFQRLAWVLATYFGVSFFFPKNSLEFFMAVAKKLIKERQAEGNTNRQDLLQLMINAEDSEAESQSRKKLTEEELIAQAFIIFSGGYETTATLLMFASYVLAMHPDIQDKLLAEIDNCIGEKKDIQYDDVMEMPYLDMFVCETLRMYPPLTSMNRTTTGNQDVEIDGHWFPANTAILFPIYLMHHHLGFYEDHEKFIPERFTAEEKAKRDPFTFMPFGQGPRNCIGMRLALVEAKIALVKMLQKVKFTQVPETEVNLDLIIHEAFLRSTKPIKVGVELR